MCPPMSARLTPPVVIRHGQGAVLPLTRHESTRQEPSRRGDSDNSARTIPPGRRAESRSARHGPMRPRTTTPRPNDPLQQTGGLLTARKNARIWL